MKISASIKKTLEESYAKYNALKEKLDYHEEKREGQIQNARDLIADYELERIYLQSARTCFETQMAVCEWGLAGGDIAGIIHLTAKLHNSKNEVEFGWQLDDAPRATAAWHQCRVASDEIKQIIENIK